MRPEKRAFAAFSALRDVSRCLAPGHVRRGQLALLLAAAFFGGRALLRRAGGAAHHGAAFLDDLARVGGAVLL
jgi:hypothetical protein